MFQYGNKWALITGASSGIGSQFAERFAQLGANLVLVARRRPPMEQLAKKLIQQYGIQVEILSADLAKPETPQAIYDALRAQGHTIQILVNNAGFGLYGRLDTTDLTRNQEQILVNVFAVSSLTQLFLTDMLKKQEGIIINLASIVAFQPVSYMSNYAASKAFVLSFSEALWAEYRKLGIRVLAVCPGPVETEFFNIAALDATTVGKKESCISVVDKALTALAKGQPSVITGIKKNFLLAQLSRFIPRALVANIAEHMMRPKLK